MTEITAIVRHHHERLDGRGYPDGLAGDAIPLGARIIAVADTFDALTSRRSYRAAVHHRRAIEIIREESGTQLDPRAAAAFVTYYSGRTPVAWWSIAAIAPVRLVQWLAGALGSASAAPLSHGASTLAAAALIGSALGAGVSGGTEPADGHGRAVVPQRADGPFDQGAARELADAPGGRKRRPDSRTRDLPPDGSGRRSRPADPPRRPPAPAGSPAPGGGAPERQDHAGGEPSPEREPEPERGPESPDGAPGVGPPPLPGRGGGDDTGEPGLPDLGSPAPPAIPPVPSPPVPGVPMPRLALPAPASLSLPAPLNLLP